MTTHLPECPVADRRGTVNPYDCTCHLPECEAYRDECGGGCICHHVRACEQRVENRFHFYTGPYVYASGYDAALDAARDAVAAVPYFWPNEKRRTYIRRTDALAAIDALRGASK